MQWAKHTLKAKPPTSMIWPKLFLIELQNSSRIFAKEVGRATSISRLSTDEAIERDVLEKTGVSIVVPLGSYAVVIDSAFTWLDRQQSGLRGLTTTTFSKEFSYTQNHTWAQNNFHLQILDRRDEVCRERVSGPTEGSYVC